MNAVVNFIQNIPFVTYFNDQFSWQQLLEFFLRIFVAGLCGACIGFERSKRYKEAGIRTHVIVCLAAAMYMLVSKYGYADLTIAGSNFFGGTHGADPSRVASQVVTGISFLGAGVIFKNGSTVKGLTTAAGIWATAAIGLAIGSGMYYIGLYGTALIAVAQVIMHKFKVGSDAASTRITLEVTKNDGFAPQLSEILSRWHAKPVETKITIGEGGSAKYDITLRTSENVSAEEIMELLNENDAVKTIGFVTTE